MKRLFLILVLCLFSASNALAVEISQNVKDFVNEAFPETNFRFDGAIILPDNTMYLPVIPAKEEAVETVEIKSSYPEKESFKQKPDMAILNNNYVLLKVINTNGKKTVINMVNPPTEVVSGLLPQEILLPKGLVIPETLKGIIGDLDVSVTNETGLRINNTRLPLSAKTTPVEQLENKTFYISTGINRNIQVVESNAKAPSHALAQEANINNMKSYDNKYLLVTYFESNTMNVISLMDEKVIKEVHFEVKPEQIIIDNKNKIAYISASENSSIYVFSLETMTLKRQLKINGLCEKLTLSTDANKILYVDRNTNDIWSIELDNNYLLKNLGSFPNISEVAYYNGKIYAISRTKNRLAIVDYETLEVISELEVEEKPVDLFIKDNELYILCAQNNILEILNLNENVITDKILLETNAFATGITPIDETLVMITNARSGLYLVFDTQSKTVVKINPIDTPIREIAVTDKVKTIK